MTVTAYHGDSRDVLKTLADNSIDSCVTDPPYALVSITKRFGKEDAAPVNNAGTKAGRSDDPYARAASGFMGKTWDTGETAFDPAFWREVLRVLKPGAHLVAFGGTRSYHRLAVAIEDAGFEIRDQLAWVYGSGFPKSHDVSKGIDKAAGAEREVVASRRAHDIRGGNLMEASQGKNIGSHTIDITAPATDAARQWQGWGTALKPAWEPICLARKPLIGTVAANVLAHGTGALNVDGCRVGAREKPKVTDAKHAGHSHNSYGKPSGGGKLLPPGRWPANLLHDGSDEVLAAFPAGEESAARYFYTAKADKGDRLGSKHPTVKPVDVMAWLTRLITPPGGVVLDPFAGSGTTGMACLREGFDAVLIEREAEYVADINRRLKHVKGEDAPLFEGTP